jgi:Animal haem peroxidase
MVGFDLAQWERNMSMNKNTDQVIPSSQRRHGSDMRGLDKVPNSSIDGGRFGRMFRWLPQAHFNEAALLALAETMIQGEFAKVTRENAQIAEEHKALPTGKQTPFKKFDAALGELEPGDENPTICSGYTYFGQFLDHDMTFDPRTTFEGRDDPDALHSFRTPRLDLDSVYGMGPGLQPYLYDDDGLHLILGEFEHKSFDDAFRPDLPRNRPQATKSNRNTPGGPRRALIGDKRNDENIIISQLHVIFMRFHNAVVNKLIDLDYPRDRLFDEAQRIVRWHYQWAVLHDFLPTIVGKEMAEKVINNGQPKLEFYHSKTDLPFMPVEFSVAAYRFGHSMVRPSYALNLIVRGGSHLEPGKPPEPLKHFNRVPIFSDDHGPLANLNGFRELPDVWAIDWSFFFDGLPAKDHGKLKVPLDQLGLTPEAIANLKIAQRSYRIDTQLVDPLALLPEFIKQQMNLRNLAFRNLLRGWNMGLPSGQAVARFMGVPEAEILSDQQLFQNVNDHNRQAVYDKHNSVFRDQAPLWFYILKEAELVKRQPDDDGGGHHLGYVGGRIVCEVIVGLVLHDRQSYLKQCPYWTPTTPGWTLQVAKSDEFGIKDIIAFAEANG